MFGADMGIKKIYASVPSWITSMNNERKVGGREDTRYKDLVWTMSDKNHHKVDLESSSTYKVLPYLVKNNKNEKYKHVDWVCHVNKSNSLSLLYQSMEWVKNL